MKINNIKNAKEIFKTEKISGRQLILSDEVEIVHLSLEPGATLENHSLPMKVFFFIIEGSGILTTAIEKNEIHTGDFIECPSGIERGWINTGNTILKIIVIKGLTEK